MTLMILTTVTKRKVAAIKYHRILSKIINQPLLVEPTTLSVFMSALSERIGFNELELHDGSVLDQDGMRAVINVAGGRDSRPYQVDGGIAIIPVVGTLTNKTGSLQPYSGMTGYDGVEAQMWMALEDPSVDQILLDIDSGGGSISGLFDLTDMINEANAIKPITAFAGELAASAAYAIASAADTVYLPRTGRVGSIGVLTVHQSIEGALDKAGVKMTIIHAGDKKVDGNPYNDLPDDVRANIQGEIDDARTLFAESVARYRGISVESVMDTEAGMFTGQAAVDVGLADGIMSFNEVLITMKKKTSTEAPAGSLSADGSETADTIELSTEEVVELAADADIEALVADDITADIEAQGAVDAVGIIDACTTAGHVELATDMIKAGLTLTEVAERLALASEISDLCVAAGVADVDILANIDNPVELVRAALTIRGEDEIDTTHMNDDPEPQAQPMSSREIWAHRQDESNNRH